MANKGVTLRDVPADKFIQTYAAHLKKAGELEVPKWSGIIKTATYKELSPENPDWFYVRTAAVARQVYLNKGTGVGALTIRYGGAERRGTKPNRFHRGSTIIAKTVLQNLEKIGVLEKTQTGGRKVTAKGQGELDRIAASLAK